MAAYGLYAFIHCFIYFWNCLLYWREEMKYIHKCIWGKKYFGHLFLVCTMYKNVFSKHMHYAETVQSFFFVKPKVVWGYDFDMVRQLLPFTLYLSFAVTTVTGPLKGYYTRMSCFSFTALIWSQSELATFFLFRMQSLSVVLLKLIKTNIFS